MGNLVQGVKNKLRQLPDVAETSDNPTVDEKKALREAIRLADLYKDVKPEQMRISGGYPFVFPEKTD